MRLRRALIYLAVFWAGISGNSAVVKGGGYESDDHTVLLMHFDEGNGLPRDSSTNGNNAAANTGKWEKKGKFGGCLRFMGSKGGYVDIPDSKSLNITNGEITIEAWVKPEDYNKKEYGAIAGKYALEGGYLLCPWGDKSKTLFFLRHGANEFAVVGTESLLPIGKWSHVAGIRRRDGTMKLYVNGAEQKGGSPFALTFASDGIPLHIGMYGYTKKSFNGVIDEVRISDIARPEFLDSDGKLKKYQNRDAAILREKSYLTGLNTEVVTPHVSWAKPYYRGEIKALAICPQLSERDLVELYERMSIDIKPVITVAWSSKFEGISHDKWSDCLPTSVLADLTRKGLKSHPDLIFIAKIDWQSIPEDIRASILKEVERGAGFVYVQPRGLDKTLTEIFKEKTGDENDFVTLGPLFRYLSLPGFGKDADYKEIQAKTVYLGKYGMGRLVMLKFANETAHHFLPATRRNDSFLTYEYCQSLLIKSILWATRKEPGVLVKAKISSPLPQAEPAKSALEVELADWEGSIPEAALTMIIKDESGRVEKEEEKSVALKEGENTVSFPMAWLKDGLHFIDVVLKNKKKEIIDWAGIPLQVNAEVKIEEVTLNKDCFKEGEEIQGKVVLSKAPQQKCDLILELEDNFGRLIKEEKVEVKDRETAFSLPIPYSFSILLKVKCALSQDGRVVDEKRREISVLKKPGENDFKFIIWDGSPIEGNLLKFYSHYSMLYRYGADAVVFFLPGKEDLNFDPSKDQYEEMGHSLARCNLQFAPYVTSISSETNKDLIRNPCLTDPDYRAKLKNVLIGRAKGMMKYSPLLFDLGDENMLTLSGEDLCFSPTCQADFREYLKKEYADLSALNREWGADFKDWEEVKPVTMEEAKKKGNLAPWIDHRMHMDSVFADIHKFGKEAIRSVDPEAKAGFEGAYAGSLSSWGYDWWKMANAMDVLCIYGERTRTVSQRLIRSFGKKGGMYGIIYGGYYIWSQGERIGDEDDQHAIPWEHIFYGFNSAMLWHSSPGIIHAAFRADLSPSPYWRWTIPEVTEIKAGVGKLILNSERVSDKVGIHYSQSSLHAINADAGGVVENACYKSLEDFYYLMEDLGVQYECVAYKQIEDGELIRGGYKALILADSQSISEKEAERMEEFVKGGGLLIADFKPGIMDGHGKMLKNGSLDKVFGIERIGAGSTNVDIKAWSNAVVEANLKLATAVAMEKTKGVPVVMVNKYGTGKAVYLNFLMDRYVKLRLQAGQGKAARDLMRNLLKENGNVERRIKLTDPSGKPVSCQTFLFRNGGMEYVGLLQNLKGENEKVMITLPHKAHVYDVRAGKYLGWTDRLADKIKYGRAKLYALAPYRVKGLRLGMKDEYKPGEVIKYSVSIDISEGKPSGHVFRLEVFDPEGAQCGYYCANLLARDGVYEGELPLALNEKKGEWRIVVKDVVSGKFAEKKFAIN